MLVVADATPLHVLIRLGCVDILRELYGQVVIPTAVERELSHEHTPLEIRKWLEMRPGWLTVKAPLRPDVSLASGLGECEALSLAIELKADFLLVDDKEARAAARRLRIAITGTVGILELAAAKGLVELQPSLDMLADVGFFIDDEIIKQALERAAFRKKDRSS